MSEPIFSVTPTARRSVTCFVTHEYTIQSTGATPAKMSAVALTPPMSWITSAKNAGYRHESSRNALIVSPIRKPSAAHGISSTEIRAA